MTIFQPPAPAGQALAALPPRAPGAGHAVPTAGGGADSASRAGRQDGQGVSGARAPGNGKDRRKGPRRGHSPGPRGLSPRRAPAPRGRARAPPRRRRRPPPPRAPSGWGWGWGAAPSPDCPGRRRPSSSCPRAPAHPADSAGPPWRCARRGRGRCPPAALPARCPQPAARSPRAVRVCSPRGSWPRPRPRPGRPRVRPARPQWQSPQAGRQGPLRSRCAPPAAQPARSGGSPARGSPGRTLALPSPQPRRKRTRGPAHTGPRGRLVPPTPAQRALTPRALASGGSQRRAPARRGPGGRPNPESKQLEIINS